MGMSCDARPTLGHLNHQRLVPERRTPGPTLTKRGRGTRWFFSFARVGRQDTTVEILRRVSQSPSDWETVAPQYDNAFFCAKGHVIASTTSPPLAAPAMEQRLDDLQAPGKKGKPKTQVP
jgi:hypothetical protein